MRPTVLGGTGAGGCCHAADATGSGRRALRRAVPDLTLQDLDELCKIVTNAFSRMAPMLARESHPSLQRPHRPPRTASRRWATSPATCGGRWHPPTRDLSPRSTPALGRGPARTRCAARRPCRRRARRGLAADPAFVARVDAAAADLRRTSASRAGTRSWAATARRRAAPDRLLLARVRHHRGAAAVLRRPGHPRRRPPQVRLRPRRADRRRRPVLQDRLLQAVAYRDGWQQETYPVLDPDGLPLSLLREADGTPVPVTLALPGGRALHAHVWRAQVGRVPLLLLDSDVQANDDAGRSVTDRLYGGGGEHRLQQEMLLGIGGVRALRLWSRLTGAPTPGRLPHQRGPRRLPRRRAHPRARRTRARADLRRGARGRARGHGVHHPHPGARPASTGSAPTRSSSTSAATTPCGRARSSGSSARRRGLPGRRGRRVQHGRHGPAPRAARQRRLAAARRGQPRRCSTASGRASTTTRCRSPRSPTACTRPTWVDRKVFELAAQAPRHARLTSDNAWDRLGAVPRRRDLGDQARAARAARRGGPPPACARPGSSAAPAGPSSAGSTTCSTPTCSPSASPAGCRRTSGSP